MIARILIISLVGLTFWQCSTPSYTVKFTLKEDYCGGAVSEEDVEDKDPAFLEMYVVHNGKAQERVRADSTGQMLFEDMRKGDSLSFYFRDKIDTKPEVFDADCNRYRNTPDYFVKIKKRKSVKETVELHKRCSPCLVERPQAPPPPAER